MQFTFFNQLSLLLWKNFRLRKRRRFPLILEMFIPLFIIFILVGVRFANLKFKMDRCELKEKQMASMGPIPFFRDFLCTFNTSCYLKTQIDWIGNNTNSFQTFVTNITDVYNSLPKENITIENLILWSSQNKNETKKLINSLIYLSTELSPLIIAMKQIESGNKTELNIGKQTLANSICGSSENDIDIILKILLRSFMYKRSTRTCEMKLKLYIGANTVGNNLYRIIAPLIFGKIYYTPNSPFNQELMMRANTTFVILDKLRLTSIKWRLYFAPWFLNEMTDSTLINSFRTFCSNNFIDFCKFYNQFSNMSNIESFTNGISQLFSWIESALNCTELNKFVPLNSSIEIDKLANSSMENIFAAIVLNDDAKYWTIKNATFLNYQIRMPTNRIDSTIKYKVLDKFWTPAPRRNTLIDFKYYTSGFLLLQEAIDHAFIEMITDNLSVNVGSSMQIMPYPCYVSDKFIIFLSNMIPFLLVIAWGPSVTNLIKSIVYEKENRLKEFMRVMGLTNLVHWLSWFISTIIVLIFPATAMTLILKYGKIIEFSSPGVLFIVLISFISSFICQSFMISVFFDKANVASVSGGIIYFLLYMPFVIFVNLQDVLTTPMYYAGGLFTQVAFANAINFIAFWEQSTEGVQFSNLFENVVVDINFGVGHCMLMMWIDSVIYLLITWYVEAVFPGQYGIPKPWYFLFTKQYWFSKTVNCSVNEIINNEIINNESLMSGFETEPTNLKLGISIRNLVKTYSNSHIPAVNHLNLNFYQSQITAFLGHNGAGKTTTISILTGIFAPTSGTAFILNQDIRSDMDNIRKSMGLCPQHNILFDTLTVEDHIYFYGLLKGLSKKDIKQILPKIVKDVGLLKKINTSTKTLSGGMKRKLSVAMAFIGNSRIVFLDEPTAGVDPHARRGIWDLLIKYRSADRTIILTTHHMDEADYLSDRIAIISQGKLQCCGSSIFLKKIYGNGYYLILSKHVKVQEEDFKENGISKSGQLILAFIRNHIHDAKLIEESRTQWTIVLPQNKKNCSKFSNLFEKLDELLEMFSIEAYGLSDTSLEEVFLKVAEDPSGIIQPIKEITRSSRSLECLNTDIINLPHSHSDSSFQEKSELKLIDLSPTPSQSITSYNYQSGFLLLFQQLLALQIKRFHYTKRDIKGFFAELIFPVLMILLMILLLKISNPLIDQPKMPISPWLMMPKSRISHLNTFYRKENISNKLVDNLEIMYRSDLGESGVRCMNKSVFQLPNFNCYYVNHKNKWSIAPYTVPMISPKCDCNKTGYQICSNSQSGGPLPSFRIMSSSDKLINLTGYNISDYLTKNFKKFVKIQYGGIQFLLPHDFGQSMKLIGESPIWNGLREIVKTSQINNDSIENLNFLHHFQSFFNLSGIKTHFTRIWINSKGYVSMPAYTNIFNNLLLRSRIPYKKVRANYGITISNYPLKYSPSDLIDQLTKKMFLELSLAVFVIFGLSFIPASFVIFLIEERVSGSKRQQFVSGVNPYIYWISNFFWDILKYTIPVLIVILIFVSFDYQSYIGRKNIGAFITLLLFYGISIIPHMYPFSFFISISSTAFVVLNAYNLLVGSITTMSTVILDILENDDVTLKPVNDILKKVFLIFPQYDLGRGMMELSINYLKYNMSGLENNYDPFDWNTTGEKLLSMFILCLTWWTVIVTIESGIINRIIFRNWKQTLESRNIIIEEDADVSMERNRINENGPTNDILKVVDLTKIYNNSCLYENKCLASKESYKRKIAVKNICFGVQEGECFGLLGINGAGKTTTFKMLSGEEFITRGDAFIDGNSIIKDMIKAHKNMGFCPQFDALHSLLNCEEELYFYCRIRGIKSTEIKSIVDTILKNLSLIVHARKLTRNLSGGNKRKLSTAIALIGLPKIIILDEPTSGMDAGARRFLWNIIQKITTENKVAVILTSHNMEECEVLCHRLAIMVNGEMKCIGSVQYLKSKFGNNYYVTIRMQNEQDNNIKIKNIMENDFPYKVLLKDENLVTLQYQFDVNSKLSLIFNFFENLKKTGIIVDYSVSQTSLDDVFISFAKDEDVLKLYNRISRTNKSMYSEVQNDKENCERLLLCSNSDV